MIVSWGASSCNWSMADVSAKKITRRVALAAGRIRVCAEAFERIRDGAMPKGDPLAMAEIAGIQAAKQTPNLIPLCHPISLNRVAIYPRLQKETHAVDVYAVAEINARTGVEMEALCAVNIALLTIWDLAKPVNVQSILKAFEEEPPEETGEEVADFSPTPLKQLEWEHIQRVLEENREAAQRTHVHKFLERFEQGEFDLAGLGPDKEAQLAALGMPQVVILTTVVAIAAGLGWSLLGAVLLVTRLEGAALRYAGLVIVVAGLTQSGRRMRSVSPPAGTVYTRCAR